MKKLVLTSAALALLAGGALAASYTASNYRQEGGARWVIGGDLDVVSGGDLDIESGGSIDFESGSVIDTSGVTFSTALTGNPLMQNTLVTVTTASANAGQIVLASATSKKIYPGGGLTMYVSGTAGGATSVLLECSGGTDVVSWPIAMLTTLQPVDAFVSKGGTVATRGTPMVSGCPAGEALQASTLGTLTTTSHLYFNIPYTVQ